MQPVIAQTPAEKRAFKTAVADAAAFALDCITAQETMYSDFAQLVTCSIENDLPPVIRIPAGMADYHKGRLDLLRGAFDGAVARLHKDHLRMQYSTAR